MANAPYLQGTVTVTSSATKVCTTGSGQSGVVIFNTGATIYLGGPNVATSGANQGVPMATGTTLTVPTVGGLYHDLYAICATTSTVSYLLPE